MTTATIVTVYVTVWTWFVGFDVARVAVPVIVTVKVAVVVAVPLNVIPTFTFLFEGFAPLKVGLVLLNATVSDPLPELRTELEVRVTAPAKPWLVTAVEVAEGRLPTLIVLVADAPELKLAVLPPTCVRLKS